MATGVVAQQQTLAQAQAQSATITITPPVTIEAEIAALTTRVAVLESLLAAEPTPATAATAANIDNIDSIMTLLDRHGIR